MWIVGYPLDSGLSQRVLNKKGFPYIDLDEGCRCRAVQYNARIVCALQITDDMFNCCPMGLTEVVCVLTQLLHSKHDVRA